eukprot:Skav218265  [mRNA]  locus=scaffold2035:200546:200893:+ [translate_table: standard]
MPRITPVASKEPSENPMQCDFACSAANPCKDQAAQNFELKMWPHRLKILEKSFALSHLLCECKRSELSSDSGVQMRSALKEKCHWCNLRLGIAFHGTKLGHLALVQNRPRSWDSR